ADGGEFELRGTYLLRGQHHPLVSGRRSLRSFFEGNGTRGGYGLTCPTWPEKPRCHKRDGNNGHGRNDNERRALSARPFYICMSDHCVVDAVVWFVSMFVHRFINSGEAVALSTSTRALYTASCASRKSFCSSMKRRCSPM